MILHVLISGASTACTTAVQWVEAIQLEYYDWILIISEILRLCKMKRFINRFPPFMELQESCRADSVRQRVTLSPMAKVELAAALAVGAAVGAVAAQWLSSRKLPESDSGTFAESLALMLSFSNRREGASAQNATLAATLANERRRLLPRKIILVRHGESEGNTDPSKYHEKADNLMELTSQGAQQALMTGLRIKRMLSDNDKVAMHVSPFERTLETGHLLRRSLGPQVSYSHIEPLIREQEFGNIQDDEWLKGGKVGAQRQSVGRFFYRYPTGESGSDVYSRYVMLRCRRCVIVVVVVCVYNAYVASLRKRERENDHCWCVPQCVYVSVCVCVCARARARACV